MKCSKCGSKNKKSAKFCHDCGTKLEVEKVEDKKKEHKHPEQKEKKSPKGIIITVSIILVVLLGLLTAFAPTKTHYYTVEVPYEDTETYYEKEPYDAQEAYQVEVPYESTETYYDTVPTQTSVPYTDYEDKVYTAGPGKYYPDVSSPCRCTDYNFWGNCVEQTCTYPVTKYKTETRQETVEKTRPVTKYKTETKYRTVTKYKDVQKSRTVMKMRDEQRQYEVNWLFNFRVPWFLHVPNLSS